MMNLTHKLRSRTGASMVMALVFLMFCTFVGGSVLASAAANAYRVEHLSDQQQYLDERSAALLIADELAPAGQPKLELTITDVTTTAASTPDAGEESGGEAGAAQSEGSGTKRTVTFSLPQGTEMTALQRVLVETTVCRYLYQSGVDLVILKNFNYRDASGTIEPITSIDADFWIKRAMADGAELNPPIRGTITITGTFEGFTTEYTAFYYCGYDQDLYGFSIDFGDASQVNVDMNAVIGSAAKQKVTDAATGAEKEITKTIVSWDEPVIEKGGVQS